MRPWVICGMDTALSNRVGFPPYSNALSPGEKTLREAVGTQV
jgi:hypothetical protein